MTDQSAPALKMQRTPKGKKPVYFDETTDRLLSMVVALTAEVAVLRGRLDTVEQLSEKGGALKQADIEAFELTPEDVARRAAWTEAYLGRVMKGVADDIERMSDNPTDGSDLFEGAHTLS
jgi:hypothetical protein